MMNLKQSLGIRLVIIGFMTLILLIPALLIQNIISEREDRRDSVVEEVNQKWGEEQTIIGPVISVPYKYSYTSDDKVEQTIRYAHILPENLNITGSITPEIRYRGIYKVIVYNSKLSISGNFPSINFNGLNVPVNDFETEDAILSVGISDMAGITDPIKIDWENEEYIANPGIASNDVIASGVSISPRLDTEKANYFDFELKVNGSSGLLFAPVGEQTNVQLSSDWPDPGFTGNYLPVKREVNATGFNSEWKVLHLNRNYPQQWVGSNQELSNSVFGVELLLSVDEYQKTMRTAKYAIMFITLTFLTFFMFELLSKKAIHPVQYLLIGFALLTFYTLLLSISEYVVFDFAYFLASSAIILLITVYSYRVLSDKLNTGIIFGVLILLYGYLYILMQLQDYALLLGSIGLFIVLTIVMFLTRNIDWFEIMRSKTNDADV
jgi:inner membrane protein